MHCKYALYKRGCRIPKQQTSLHSNISVTPEELQAEQAATTPWMARQEARGLMHRITSQSQRPEVNKRNATVVRALL